MLNWKIFEMQTKTESQSINIVSGKNLEFKSSFLNESNLRSESNWRKECTSKIPGWNFKNFRSLRSRSFYFTVYKVLFTKLAIYWFFKILIWKFIAKFKARFARQIVHPSSFFSSGHLSNHKFWIKYHNINSLSFSCVERVTNNITEVNGRRLFVLLDYKFLDNVTDE